MSGRRVVFLSLAAVLLAIAYWLAYLAVAGNKLENEHLLEGGSIILVSVAVAIGVRCIRWRSSEELRSVDDPNAIVHVALSGFEARTLGLSLLGMAVGFGFIASDGGSDIRWHVLSWLGAVSCAVWSVMLLVTGRPVTLRLAPEGLNFSGFGFGPIPWKDIRAAKSTWAFGRIPIVALDLNNEEEYQSRRRGLRSKFFERLLLSSSFTIAPPTMDMSCDMLVKAIEIRIAAFGRGSQPA